MAIQARNSMIKRLFLVGSDLMVCSQAKHQPATGSASTSWSLINLRQDFWDHPRPEKKGQNI